MIGHLLIVGFLLLTSFNLLIKSKITSLTYETLMGIRYSILARDSRRLREFCNTRSGPSLAKQSRVLVEWRSRNGSWTNVCLEEDTKIRRGLALPRWWRISWTDSPGPLRLAYSSSYDYTFKN